MVMEFNAGDRVRVLRLNTNEVDFYATLKDYNDGRSFILSDCSDGRFECCSVFKSNTEEYGLNAYDYYVLAEDEENKRTVNDLNVNAYETKLVTEDEEDTDSVIILTDTSDPKYEGDSVFADYVTQYGVNKLDYYTIVEEKEDLLSYNGGSMTTFGSRDFCLKVDEQLKKAGLSPYTPSNNKEINDKDSVGNKDIARMIVAKDSEAIINSDVRTFNAEQTPGTLIETGQVLGMHDFAHIIQLTIEKMEEMGKDDEDIKDIIWNICASEIGKSFILYDTDIRSHEEPEAGYKRSKGYHQYQRGVGMKLMNDEDGYVRYENLDKELENIDIDKSVFSVEMDNDGFIVDVKNIFE